VYITLPLALPLLAPRRSLLPSPTSPAVYTSSSLQDYSCPHFPWHWGFFRGLARESIVPERGGSRSRQAAKCEQTDRSQAKPTPTALEVDTRFPASLYLFAL